MEAVKELKPAIPTSEDRAIASNTLQPFTKFLKTARTRRGVAVRVVAGNTELSVPVIALELFFHVLSEMSKGNAITVLPYHAELTTQEAADLLNVSRPFLVELLDEKKIPFRKVGKHRRVRVEDLMSYKEKTDTDRRKILDALAKEAQELGIGY